MRYLLALWTSIFVLLPNIVVGDTWVCGYKVHGELKTTQFKRTAKGFEAKGFYEPIKYSILSDTDRRIALVLDYNEGVFVTILDKKHKEFVSSVVVAPAQLRRGGAKMDTHKFNLNHGRCEVLPQ